MKPKVVHVWNTAGIGGLLARYLDRYYDYDSIAVTRKYQLYEGEATEKTKAWNCGAKEFVIRTLLVCRNADIIHCHGAFRVYPILRQAFKKKKIVMHWHGTKIRGKWDQFKDLNNDADMVLISTPDLFDENTPDYVIYLPNPVNEELCKEAKNSMVGFKIKNKAFHSPRYALDVAQRYAQRHGLNLILHDRDSKPLPKLEYLKRICQYEHYIDVKRDFPDSPYSGKILRAFSLSGLEALFMGCKVICWDGTIYEGFPYDHESHRVAELLNECYKTGWKDRT